MQNPILYTWKSIALNPSSSGADKNLDLSGLAIEDALCVAYPQLTFCELVDLYFKIKLSTEVNGPLLFSFYNFHLDSKMQKLLEAIPTFPNLFWSWSRHHSLSPRDLYPLLSLKDPQQISLSLQKIVEQNISRSLGAQVLELLVECYLLGSTDSYLADILQSQSTIESGLENLKSLRYPQTTQTDQKKQQKLLSLPWTKDFQTRWLRHGDRSGLEIRFFASNASELKKYSDQLMKISQLQENESHEHT